VGDEFANKPKFTALTRVSHVKTKDYGFALYSDIILEVLEERKKLKIDTAIESSVEKSDK